MNLHVSRKAIGLDKEAADASSESILGVSLVSGFEFSEAVYTVAGGAAHRLAACYPCTWQGDEDDSKVVLFPQGIPLWVASYSQSGMTVNAVTPEAKAMETTPLTGMWAVCGYGNRPRQATPYPATIAELVVAAADHHDYSRLLTEAEAMEIIRIQKEEEAEAEAERQAEEAEREEEYRRQQAAEAKMAAIRRNYSGTRLFGQFRRAGIPEQYWMYCR